MRWLRSAGHVVYLGSRDLERGRLASGDVVVRPVALGRHVRGLRPRHGRDGPGRGGTPGRLVNNAGITGPLRDVHDYEATDLRR